MKLKLVKYGTADYDKMVELRNTVLLAPIGLPYFKEVLEKDSESFLCVYFDDKEDAVGCCVLTEIDRDIIQLRQMAVASDLQNKGIGAQVVAFAEQVAKENGYGEIMLHARRVAENFYLQNGYRFVGDEFDEVGIAHMEMRKML